MRLSQEQLEQILLFNWIRANPELEPVTFHIANERKCSPQEGLTLKRMGVKPGVSDIFAGVPKGGYHGLFLELKVNGSKPNKKQKDFLSRMSDQGYYAIWIDGYRAAIDAITEYLSLQ